MRLVWSQSVSAQCRPRQVLLLAVVCLFLGSVVGGNRETPRAFRAAAASLVVTGGLFFFAGVAGLALRKGRSRSPTLSLAATDPSADPQSLSRLQEEEQR